MKTFFIAASDYPMLGMSDVLSDFQFITLYGDGAHCLNPLDIDRDHQGDFYKISNSLISSPSLKSTLSSYQQKAMALFVMYDQKTIELTQSLGLIFGHSDIELRDTFDHKLKMAQFAQTLKIPITQQLHITTSHRPTYSEASKILGDNIIIQHPFGSSGMTTFRVKNNDEWNAVLKNQLFANSDLRACEYLNCFCLCVDACVIDNDAVVGPIMTEINGNPELTTLENSWCGNQVSTTEVPQEELIKVQQYVRQIGQFMASQNFRGYYSVDFLFDKKSQRAIFSEVNPRVSGGSTVANLCMHYSGLRPLIGLHVDSQIGINPKVQINLLNKATLTQSQNHFWSQIIFKNTSAPGTLSQVPRRGIIDIDPRSTPHFEESYFSLPPPNPTHVYFTPEARVGDFVATDAEIGSLLSTTPLYESATGILTQEGKKALATIKKLIEIKPDEKNTITY